MSRQKDAFAELDGITSTKKKKFKINAPHGFSSIKDLEVTPKKSSRSNDLFKELNAHKGPSSISSIKVISKADPNDKRTTQQRADDTFKLLEKKRKAAAALLNK